MIRIDLKKDGLISNAAGRPTSSLADKIGMSQKWRGYLEKFKDAAPLIDARIILTWVVALALAFVPHLFVAQWRHYLESQNERAIRELNVQDDSAKQEIARYNSLKREMESYEKQKDLVKRRLETVKQLLEQRNTPVNVLDALGQSLPRRRWLTDVDLDIGSKDILSLKGKAYSNEDIADFSDKLSESIYLSDVVLVEVNEAQIQDKVQLKSFEMTAVPKGTNAVSVPEDRGMAALPVGAKDAPESERKP